MKVYIDLDRAKKIKKDKIREDRKPLLEEQDVLYMRALEANDAEAKNAIVLEKQRLRDITLGVDECLTVEELSSFSIGTA